MDTGRSGRKIRDSARKYLAWRQEHFWERFGRFHPETVSYSQAINLLNEAAVGYQPAGVGERRSSQRRRA